ncbi:hypothetical protein [Pseudonocardia spinosispora]|uniref:hypothetical protein n=1 Tax=Pseudonocardia spinosispora TaxID=103441 RepID=UPI0004140B7C|nr:hypothetical protein [Pseudonocardia spinosispora]
MDTTSTEALARFRAQRDQLLAAGNRAEERAAELDVAEDCVVPEAEEHYNTLDTAMQRYQELLPELPISRCPFTDEVLTWAIDTVDLDGWFWDRDNPVRRFTGAVPPHFLALGGSMRVHTPLTWAPFLTVPGPGAPAVVPEILDDPDVVAVISQLSIGPHTGWPVTYWAPAAESCGNWSTTGAATTTTATSRTADPMGGTNRSPRPATTTSTSNPG